MFRVWAGDGVCRVLGLFKVQEVQGLALGVKHSGYRVWDFCQAVNKL